MSENEKKKKEEIMILLWFFALKQKYLSKNIFFRFGVK